MPGAAVLAGHDNKNNQRKSEQRSEGIFARRVCYLCGEQSCNPVNIFDVHQR